MANFREIQERINGLVKWGGVSNRPCPKRNLDFIHTLAAIFCALFAAKCKLIERIFIGVFVEQFSTLWKQRL